MNEKDFVVDDGVFVLYKYKGKDKNVIIPDRLVKIDDFAFAYCKSLVSINIPNTIKYIRHDAFAFCESLETLNIPSSVTFIGCDAFEGIKPIKRPHPIDGKVIAYKAFDKYWTCRKFKYEVGKSYHQDGDIECCENGFHACLNPLDVFGYYWGDLDNLRFAEVELSGDLDWESTKVAASDIRIIRELTASELADIYNNMEKC